MTKRQILEDVASGRITATQGVQLLEAWDGANGEGGGEGGGGGDGGPEAEPLARVRLAVAGYSVRILGDAGVREAVAEGPYVLTREGDTLVITAESEDGPGGRGSHSFAFAGPGAGPWAWRGGRDRRGPRPLTVRMNPRLALAAEVTAGSCAVNDVKGPINLTVSAGGVRVMGFAGPIDVDVTAGGFVASGVLNQGASRLRCSAGSARIGLERGSSVRIRGTASAGRLVLPHGAATAGARRARGMWVDQEMESVIGAGEATLDVEVTTGNVVIRSEL